MANMWFPIGLDRTSEVQPVSRDGETKARGSRFKGLPRRWLYGVCAGVFCFGLLSVAMAIGEDKYVAKATIYAVEMLPSQHFDLPMMERLPDAIVRQVVEAESLATDPEFTSQQLNGLTRVAMVFGWIDFANHQEKIRDQAVISLEQAVNLRSASQTDLLNEDSAAITAPRQGLSHRALEIEVESEDAVKAARIANALAQALVDAQKQSSDKEEAHRQSIANEVAGFATRLQIAKQNLADFREAQDQGKSADQTGSIGDHIDAAVSLADAKADADMIARAIATGRTSTLATLHIPTPDLDRLLSQYADLQQQYQKRRLTLGDKHPDLLALDDELRGLQKAIHTQWLKALDIANRAYRAAQTRAAASANMASAAPDLVPDGAGSDKLQSDVVLAQADYERALHMQAKEDASAANQPSLNISQAKVPLSAAHRPHGFILGAAMMLGAMFGFGRSLVGLRRTPRRTVPGAQKPEVGAFSSEEGANSRKDTAIKRSKNHLPIPRIKTDWLAEKLGMKPPLDAACCEVLDHPRSDFSLAIEDLFDRAMEDESRGAVKILFVSKHDGLGGTTVAVNFAQIAAKAGYRVLIIEANRRHPVLASLVSPNVSVDLIDLAGTERIVCHLRAGFSMIPLFDDETTEVLSAQARHCLKGISKHFDLVVIDGGTFGHADKMTLEMLDAVNRVFHLTLEGIDLKASRKSVGHRSIGERRRA